MSYNKDFQNYKRKDDDDEQMARDMQLALDLQMADMDVQELTSLQSNTLRTGLTTDTFELEHGLFSIQAQKEQDHMLFVSCTIDARKVDLMVDSGASVSAMSLTMVRKLGLMDKFNANISGACGGVGSASIVGVVENLTCLIGHVEFRLYFMILDSSLPSVVLGLDQMRRFKCVIDLESNCLCFGGKDGVKVPFLDSEKARKARKSYDRNIRDQGDNNTRPGGHPPAGGNAHGGSSGGWISSLFGKNRSLTR